MRIGIVNDSPMAVETMRRVLALRPLHEIAWVAWNGAEAVECCLRDTPDLVLMDLVMPVMDGVVATRQIMAKCPCAIVVVTVSVNENVNKVFEAMGAGAVDAVDTPALSLGDSGKGSASLLAKIDMMNRLLGGNGVKKASRPRNLIAASGAACPLVAIGASAGGPAALAQVLGGLPIDFPAAVVIVQHVDEQFAPSLASWLAGQSILPVLSAGEGDRPVPGQVLLAVQNNHLVCRGAHQLGYTENPSDVFYRPSVDVFFESIAKNWEGDVIGVLLTGMGRDGAKGLKRLRDDGYHTIAQDQATCAVYGMPKAAAQLDAAAQILPLPQIAPALIDRLRQMH